MPCVSFSLTRTAEVEIEDDEIRCKLKLIQNAKRLFSVVGDQHIGFNRRSPDGFAHEQNVSRIVLNQQDM